jgi:hypothetical protein
MPAKQGTGLGPDGDAGNMVLSENIVLEMAASYGLKPTVVLSEPVAKRGSEVADSSVLTSAEEGSDLDEETARNRTSGRTLRL